MIIDCIPELWSETLTAGPKLRGNGGRNHPFVDDWEAKAASSKREIVGDCLGVGTEMRKTV